ncbi:hypothetical protein WA026_019583 [Henosepilachna vigintioctopunctata]|uniref:Uncharacterized protein n=1 Tax=Henosepilachna vigintioctopunctata TaxID=420089 RepID=A0AAW1TR28_9CUCU
MTNPQLEQIINNSIRTRLALQRTISEVAEFNLRGTGVLIDIDEFLKAIREFGAPISEEDEDFIRKEWIPSLSDATMKRNFDDTIDRWILYSLDCAYASNVTFGHMNRTREEADSEYIHRVIERRDEVYAAVNKASVEVELDSEKTGSNGELGYFRRERKHKFNVKKSRTFVSWLSEATPNAIFGKREKRSGKRGKCSVKLIYEAGSITEFQLQNFNTPLETLTNPSEINHTIRKTNNKKAPRQDKTNNRALKEMSKKGKIQLT